MEEQMTHEAPVHKEELLVTALTCKLGKGNEAIHFHQSGLSVDGCELTFQCLAEQCADSLLEGTGKHLMESYVIMYEGEAHRCIYQRQALKFSQDVTELNAVFLEELAACGHMEKDVLHHDICARHAADRLCALKA